MRLAPIKSRVPLGSSIRVSTHTGEPLEGILLDIDDECLIISAHDSEIILEASAIAKVERLSPAASAVNGTAGLPRAVPDHLPQARIPDAVVPARAKEADFPAGALQALADLESQVRGVVLDIGAPQWTVYDADLGIEERTQLNRQLVNVRNRYENALKMREPERIPQYAAQLRKIAEAYEAPDALQIAGRLLWHAGEQRKARDLFAEAADALNDSSSSFDLAIAQRLTDERELAPLTLSKCLDEDSPPRDPALMGLAAIVLTEREGKAELAGLVRDAGAWRSGASRLAVLHCGLICVSKTDLIGFPADQCDSPNAPATAFDVLARTLHARPAEPGEAVRPGAAVVPAAVGEPAAVTADAPSPASRGEPRLSESAIRELAVRVHACLNRNDVPGAAKALDDLRQAAPLESLTRITEQAVAKAKRESPPKPRPASRPIPRPIPRPSSLPAPARPAPHAPYRKPAQSGGLEPRDGPFIRAEEASRTEDLATAQRLYEEAIAEGDQPVRAVRRLAELLSTRLKKRDEALAVLKKNRRLFRTSTELWAWSQMLSTVLEHAGRWEEAAEQLRLMLRQAPTSDDRIRVIRRTTVALLKSFQYQEAKELLEHELKRNPRHTASLQPVLDQLYQAMETNIFSAVEETLQQQADATSGLSPLLAFHLERCEYWGVRAESLARREFSEDDIKRLDDLVSGRAKRLGKDFPRERAEANLSAARIMQDLGITDEGFRLRLRYFAAAMGDAWALEGNGNADVIRAYYSEAVSVNGSWDDVVAIKLRQLVKSFTQNDAGLLDIRNLPQLEEALPPIMSGARHLSARVLVALLALPTQGETATRLIRRIWANHTTREIFRQALAAHLGRAEAPADQASFTAAWVTAAEQDRNRRKVYRQISALVESGSALSALDRHSDLLQRVSGEVSELASPTDLARISDCLAIITSLREYMNHNVYVERERLFGNTRTSIRDKVKEFESGPTVLSLEILRPYLSALERELEQDFQQYDASVAPRTLKVEQVVDRYLPSENLITVQLQVSNSPDASPVSNVELEIRPSNDYKTARGMVPVAGLIGAGGSSTCQVSLVASAPAIAQELITLKCRVHFTLRSAQREVSPEQSMSIHLRADEEWEEIPNPYNAGPPVENPAMFKGRDKLIADLVETVGRSRGSVIVYGQKRAGKSSVLYHLAQKLALPDLAVRFSIGDLAASMTLPDLLYLAATEIYATLSELSEDRALSETLPPRPDVGEIRLAPQLKFYEYMQVLQKWMKNIPELADCRLVLLIDEFTAIHKKIHDGSLPGDFMLGWKALLERGYFRCVLVGNDLMPSFIEDFKNEFQVAGQKRVSYLDEIDARKLIVDPIKLPDDSSRYRGNAVERILDLTGCSPYYIQLFCQRLVLYMNRDDVRAPAIGPADVDTVAKQLIAEVHKNQFDGLLTPGDSEVTDIADDLVIEVLRATRRDSGSHMYHEANLSHPGENAHPEAARVIGDLVRREVLKQLSGNRYRIQVGLFSEWLQHQWG